LEPNSFFSGFNLTTHSSPKHLQMSHNRADWFNPTSPAYYRRQSQLRGNYSYSSCSASYSSYGCGTTTANFCSGISFAAPKREQSIEEIIIGSEEYFNHDKENDKLTLTAEGFSEILNVLEVSKRNRERLRML